LAFTNTFDQHRTNGVNDQPATQTLHVRVRPHLLSGVRPDVPRSRRVVTVLN
jgi:hypothetical protein